MPTIRLKRRTSGGAGAPASLGITEPAYNEVDGVLYLGLSNSTIAAIAGPGAFCTLTTAQTISGAKTFSGAATFSSTVALGGSATATTPATSDSSTAVATTAFVKAQAGINATGTVTSVALSLPSIFTVSGSPVTTTGTLTAALASQTANTMFAAPNGAAGAPTFRALVAADIPTLTASKISDFDTQVRTSALNQLATATANYSMGGFTLTNLAAPVNANDAARKADVDAAQQGLDVKASCRAATTANITLSGTQTIDGVAVIAGDRVLVKNQTTGSENGIYLCAAGAWTRATDADTSAKLTAGAFTFIEEGSTLADTGWVLSTNQPVVVGTTALTFNQFSGGGVPSNYSGQTTITTLGTVTTGTWNATTVAVPYGGTGATTLTGIIKGNGTSAFTAAVADTDYLTPSSNLDGGTF